MPSKKKISREQALRWAQQGEPAPGTLSWRALPSATSIDAAATLVGTIDRARVVAIAERIDRIVAFTATASGAHRQHG